jgi:ribosomal protein S2
VSSARLGLKPCHEAQCLGLPALTINDTNSAASMATLAIPANEESTTALWFYTNLLSTFILHRKFGLVNRFLLKSRRRSYDRRRLSAATAASLFASRDLWRRFSLTRL